MPVGPGKYDKECEVALRSTSAETCLLIVLGGARGSGFSMSIDVMRGGIGVDVPRILRTVADQIEKEGSRC